MAMLCFLGMWALYFWLARICLRGSVATARAKGRTTSDAREAPLVEGSPIPSPPSGSRRTGRRTVPDPVTDLESAADASRFRHAR